LLTDPQTVLSHVVTLREEEEKPVEAAVATVPAEPEVIKKGKKEVEGEEGEEGAKPAEKQEKKSSSFPPGTRQTSCGSLSALAILARSINGRRIILVFWPWMNRKSRFHPRRAAEGKALVGLGKVAGQEVVLAKPQTYMNLSGISVRDLLEKYELGPEDLLVMFDERDLPWGMIRIGERGSAGTHNGAKSVTSVVGTQEFARLRLGCGPDHPVGDLADYVLRPMKKTMLEVASEMVVEAGDAVELILTQGIAAAMNQVQPPRAAGRREVVATFRSPSSKRFSRAQPPGTEGNEVIMEERLYDLIFIARPATPEDEIKKVITTIEHAVAEKGGKIEKTEHWGNAEAAYKVAKHREGIYVYQQVRTNHGELVHELERRLGVLDSVIKYQTIRLDEEIKRQKKLSHKREQRAARRPRRVTQPPVPPAPAEQPPAPPSSCRGGFTPPSFWCRGDTRPAL